MKNTQAQVLAIKKPSESNLSSIIRDIDSQSFLITSANAKSGVTSSALILADELSKTTNDRTLIIDVSLSKNSLTELLGKADDPGLVDIKTNIEATTSFEKNYYKVENFNFYFMPIGFKKENTQDIIHKELNTILKKLSKEFRYIIIDGDSIYSNNNTIEIAAKTDAVILVVQAEETRWEVAQAAQKRLSQAGANIIGCIFNNRKYYTPNWIYKKL
ncbi:MAG: CpsD/CapB family tyrosine-protein kinase [Gammaproteobacteria bacterium]|nr:CpsD/CapB family tyrosine-protein kinase [Gammaproteobacteria bacterium]